MSLYASENLYVTIDLVKHDVDKDFLSCIRCKVGEWVDGVSGV